MKFTKSIFGKGPTSKGLLVIYLALNLAACLKKQNEFAAEQSIDQDAYASEVFTESLSEKTSTDSAGNEQIESPFIENDIESGIADQAARSQIPICREEIANSGCVVNGAASAITLTFRDCRLANTYAIANGEVTYLFNNASCSIRSDGDSVNRQFDINLNKLFRASAKLSTARHENYLGEVYGGGGILTNTVAGWEIEILGRYHQLKSAAGRVLADVSVHSEGKFEILKTGGGRTVSGGTLVIDHNLAKYTAKYSPRSLTWDTSCLCPVSGLVDITFSGSKNGSGSLEFLSCGVAKISRGDGSSRKLEMPRCFAE